MGGGNRVVAKTCTHRFELLLLPATSIGAEHLTRRVDVVEAPAHGGAGRMLVAPQGLIPRAEQEYATVTGVVELTSPGTARRWQEQEQGLVGVQSRAFCPCMPTFVPLRLRRLQRA
jgi:hypothetical protein